jgi:hypothetical protein
VHIDQLQLVVGTDSDELEGSQPAQNINCEATAAPLHSIINLTEV